jgi:Ca2+-binding RTX toxin-like protein
MGTRHYEGFGYDARGVGDLNGDGYDDLILGSAKIGTPGAAYVLYGSSGSGTDVAANSGVKLSGVGANDRTGYSVSGAGDVNGDGFDDLIIGTPYAGSGYGNGAAYVVFGGNFTQAVAFVGGAGNDTLSGTIAAEAMVGGTGGDTLISLYGNDTLAGGAGSDVFLFNDSIDGVHNVDLIRDFETGVDHIELDNSIFTSFAYGGTVAAANVQVAQQSAISDTSGDANDYLKYAANTGNLYYDSNGSAANGLTLIARVTSDGLMPAALHFGPGGDVVIVGGG